MWKQFIFGFAAFLVVGVPGRQAFAANSGLAEQLRALDPIVFPVAEQKTLAKMLSDDAETRRNLVNQQDREAWRAIQSKADWEEFVTPRIGALRKSLGDFLRPPNSLNVHAARTTTGDGFRIENLVYESRPGVFVTANLYSPSQPRAGMPGIVFIHSHHNPKTQGELQDMGMIWARAGCAVLVPDQLGYGERRDHRAGSRQDYRFRYISALQLHTIGDSLIGWMAWDVARGVDLLLGRAGIDRGKIVLIGSVAGGGDPAAVTASLDPRIACVVPFNFGGPQPETRFPLPANAAENFNYMGGGSWESTRNLRLSGRDGFLPWIIVASVAPRRLIYAHEFSWDRLHDPVWQRLQTVFAFYSAGDNLDFTHGRGLVTGQPPEATHCNNVGEEHRKRIHPALQRWFDVSIPQERQTRLPPEELTCLTPVLREQLKPRPLHEVLREIGATRATAMREELARLVPDQRRKRLQFEWARLLGEVEPKGRLAAKLQGTQTIGDVRAERIALEVEPHIVVPTLLLRPNRRANEKLPVIVCLSQHGKARFLRECAGDIAELLAKGIAVCLPDVRGVGESSPGGSRERQTEATSISATELMLGQALLGSRLRDARSVLRYLKTRSDLDADRVALWGTSFSPTNPLGFTDPLIGEEAPPHQSEPLGGLLALFGGLYEDGVHAVVAQGTLAGYESVLRDTYCYVPHDTIVPGALTAGDLGDLAGALAPRPLRLEALVDGRNCPMPISEVRQIFQPALDAYLSVPDNFRLGAEKQGDLAAWLVNSLKKGKD